MFNNSNVHQDQSVLAAGAALNAAKGAVIMIHGRGATAEDILSLSREFERDELAYLAPQAAGHSWYPQRFIAPIESNEPALSSALRVIEDLLGHVAAAGIKPEQTVLLGFSQGACLAVEYAARNPQRYGGVAVLSGGLIGPEGVPLHYDHADAKPLAGTPILLGCSDTDFHIPLSRVQESAEVLSEMGAQVDMRIYPGMGHTINGDEIEAVRAMLAGLK